MIKKIFSTLLLVLITLNFAAANENRILKIGNENAKVTIKVFSSLTCPHCAKFHLNIFKNLKNEYIDNNKVIFEHHSFPLDLAALNAEKVLRATNDYNKSFELLNKIYETQNQWAVGSDINKINELIKKIALDFGLTPKQIDKFLNDEMIQDQILEERINAQKNYKIESTPTIYINNKKYDGKHEYSSFKKALDKEL
mgnify:CR=1 FL=1